MSSLRIGEQGAENALKGALGYLYQSYTQENSTNERAIALSYNRSIDIINETFKEIGDKHVVKNDIDKLKQMQQIIGTLTKSEHADIRYMGKSLATLLSELII